MKQRQVRPMLKPQFDPTPEEQADLTELETVLWPQCDSDPRNLVDSDTLIAFQPWLEWEAPEMAQKYQIGLAGDVYRKHQG